MILTQALSFLPEFSLRTAAFRAETQNIFKDMYKKEMDRMLGVKPTECPKLFATMKESEKNLKSQFESLHAYVAFAPDDRLFKKDEVQGVIEKFDKLAKKIFDAVPNHETVKIGECKTACLIEEMRYVKERLFPNGHADSLVTGKAINDVVKQLIAMLRITVNTNDIFLRTIFHS